MLLEASMSISDMDCWATPDDGILVRLESPEACASEHDDEVWLLLDAWRDIDRVWRDDSQPGEESECRVSYEVEDGVFVGVVEERFDGGRTNFAREIEIEDLEPLDENQVPAFTDLVLKLREWRD